jgi:hypothetical protein
VGDDPPYRVIDERTLRLDSGFGPEDYRYGSREAIG